MKSYIDRNEAINRLQDIANDYERGGDMDAFYVADYCLHHIMDIEPIADVAEVKHAHLVSPNPYGECSVCGMLIDIRDCFNYCPKCGSNIQRSL